MDRLTFRRIILASRIAQRERFEEVLRHMSVFSSLSPGQKASIADCLVLEVFEVCATQALRWNSRDQIVTGHMSYSKYGRMVCSV